MDLLFNLGASLTSTEPCDFAERTKPAISRRESYFVRVWAYMHHKERKISRGQMVVFSLDQSTTP